MEQKRTLWVIAASGVFLLVVVGAALILYSPSVHKSQAAQAAFNQNDGWTAPITGTSQLAVNPFATTLDTDAHPFDSQAASVESSSQVAETTNATASPFDTDTTNASNAVAANSGNVVTSSQNLLPSTVQTNSVTLISDNTTVVGTGITTIDLNALKASTAAPSSSVTAQNATTQAQIAQAQQAYERQQAQTNVTVQNYVHEPPRPATQAPAPAVRQEVVAKAPEPAPTTATAAPKTAVAKSATTTATAAAKPAVTSTKQATKPAARSTTIADTYWVQAASYSTKKSADNARATLESNKIPSEIFTYTDTKGTVFYRVRVGPYTTSNEAEYWKTQVAKIDQFASADSYVVNSSAKAVK